MHRLTHRKQQKP